MSAKSTNFILFSVAALFGASAAYGGAWTQAEGHGLLIATHNYYTSSHFFDARGKEARQRKYTKNELNFYLEYGFTNNLTIGANTLLQRVRQGNSDPTASHVNYGQGDTELFVRKQLLNSPFALSVQPFVKIPTFFSVEKNPPIGTDSPDLGVTVSGGYGFMIGERKAYINLDNIYRYRFGKPNDQLRFDLTAGFEITPNWSISPQIFTTFLTQKPRNTNFVFSDANDYNQMKFQLSLTQKVRNDITLQYGVFTDIKGENTGKGKGFLVALWKTF